jgi:hypothetical protein
MPFGFVQAHLTSTKADPLQALVRARMTSAGAFLNDLLAHQVHLDSGLSTATISWPRRFHLAVCFTTIGQTFWRVWPGLAGHLVVPQTLVAQRPPETGIPAGCVQYLPEGHQLYDGSTVTQYRDGESLLAVDGIEFNCSVLCRPRRFLSPRRTDNQARAAAPHSPPAPRPIPWYIVHSRPGTAAGVI